MVDKVLFMPFDERQPTVGSARFEYGNTGKDKKNQAFIDHEMAKGKTAVSVWYNGKRNAHLASLSRGQIYIRGHGMPGENVIEGGRGGEKVRYDEVIHRLVKSGLKKNFAGKIKCYNCHSAETIGVEGNMWPQVMETNGMPFAQLIADELYASGYKNCTFYGYVGAIDSMQKDGSQGVHRYRRVKIKGADGRSQEIEMGRMSENRFQFYPVPVPKKPSRLAGLFR